MRSPFPLDFAYLHGLNAHVNLLSGLNPGVNLNMNLKHVSFLYMLFELCKASLKTPLYQKETERTSILWPAAFIPEL